MGYDTQNLQLTCKNLGTSEFGDSICDGDIQLYGRVYFFCLIINAPFHCFEQVIIFKTPREEQVTVVEQEVIITNNNLLSHFSGDNSGCLYTKLLLSKT